ncbi:MAG TPA: hypothetical protein VJY54_01670 [Lachnospiraceae bacterium]|nr:hypothetical protein [Lachnospiraceae bacterium]
MDGYNGVNQPLGGNMFWGLPVAFALNETAAETVGNMTDEEREVLRERSSGVTSDQEMDELVRMVVEGRFE